MVLNVWLQSPTLYSREYQPEDIVFAGILRLFLRL